MIFKTFVVTGSTSGIGLETARQLCEQGAFIIGVGRSPERCARAEAEIKSTHPSAQVVYLQADLSLQAQVRALADRIRQELISRQISSLDGLINDAGLFSWSRQETSEGFEMQWAVNHLAPFLLTYELLPLLAVAPAARIVTVSSGSHYNTRLKWDDLQLKHGYSGFRAYRQTKLCNVFFTAELRRRLGMDGPIRAFAADPGLVHTAIGQKTNPAFVRWFWGWWSRRGNTPERSARGVVFLATEPITADSPEIYWRHSQPVPPDPVALDPESARRIWEISTKIVGIQW